MDYDSAFTSHIEIKSEKEYEKETRGDELVSDNNAGTNLNTVFHTEFVNTEPFTMKVRDSNEIYSSASTLSHILLQQNIRYFYSTLNQSTKLKVCDELSIDSELHLARYDTESLTKLFNMLIEMKIKEDNDK